MSARRRINQQDTRKLVRNCISYTIHEAKALSRRGAFHFQTSGFGRLIVIDNLALSSEERALFAPFLSSGQLVRKLTPGELIDEILEPGAFTNPPGESFRAFSNPDFEQQPIWLFARQAWCLPHIFAGLACCEDESHIALKHYDAIFALSSHDRMRARHCIARLNAATTTV